MNQALLGGGGAILCVLIGQLLARWSQRAQWLRDRKTEELRELVAALTAATAPYEMYIVADGHAATELETRVLESIRSAERVIDDRLFIRKEMKALKMSDRFFSARENFSEDKNLQNYRKLIDGLIDDIANAAEKL